MSDPLLPVSTSTDIDIPFQDIDAMEIVWHGNYPRYLEIARCALLDCIHYDYPAMRDSGYTWPVIDMRIKYIKPLHFKQRIRVRSEIKEYENRLKIDFLITDATSGEKLCKAYSIQVAVDMKTQEMCFVSPPILCEKLAAYQQAKHAINQEPKSGTLA
ncbi:MAG: acyl-CoA thioesterase [Cellvibrionales bacterium]|jgi:acyl-CoA thioester hydrolase|nr:acyl-CoA thioesterase [Cellvibrionales bacterium]MBK8676708.1 acyl-CoA thioesterase [Cellvibrionales bacterium]HRF87080.1 thioesterase family protein [Pseudomonadales bacterium]HRG50012.1 thioesterase family protein [Pseudomonadales bacterium]